LPQLSKLLEFTSSKVRVEYTTTLKYYQVMGSLTFKANRLVIQPQLFKKRVILYIDQKVFVLWRRNGCEISYFMIIQAHTIAMEFANHTKLICGRIKWNEIIFKGQ